MSSSNFCIPHVFADFMKVIPLRHSNRSINPNLVAYFTNDQLAEQDFKKKEKIHLQNTSVPQFA